MKEYNKETIINGKVVSLSSSEREGVERFHNNRIAFAFLQDGTLTVNSRDKREHRVYLKEDFGVTDEEMETLVRGYIKPGVIVFYITSSFLPVEVISATQLNSVLGLAGRKFGNGVYELKNGVIVGVPGKEWNFIQGLGKYEI